MPTASSANVVRAGPEVVVNTPIVADAGRDVCSDAAGNKIVVWSSGVSGFVAEDVFVRRYDSSGEPLGAATQVEEDLSGPQGWALLDCAPDGSFMVVWQSGRSSEPGDGDNAGVFARPFDTAGLPAGGQFQVNTYTTGFQGSPAICRNGDGDYLIAWFDDRSNPGSVRTRWFDASGNPLTAELEAISGEDSLSDRPAAACDGSDGAVVVWPTEEPTFQHQMVARKLDSTTGPLGTEFLVVGTTTVNILDEQEVSIASDDSFVVSWRTRYGTGWSVFARQFDGTGTPAGTEFRVPNSITRFQDAPHLAHLENDGFVVVWRGRYQDDTTHNWGGIFGQRFDAAATPVGTEFFVNSYRVGLQGGPRVAADPDDGFTVVWETLFGESTERLQRFCDPLMATCDLCPGHDDSLDADADGVPDGCDPCTLVDAGQLFASGAKLLMRGKKDEEKSVFKLAASFGLAPGQTFDDLDPLATGARLLVRGDEAGELVNAALAGGAYQGGSTAGWKVGTTRLIYRDRTGTPPHGINKVVVRKVDDTHVAVRAVGKNDVYPLVEADVPIAVTMLLGDQAAAALGRCGQSAFAPGDCAFNNTGRRIVCR